MNNKGVTLIELLVVIVVIGIISAFAVPAVGNFIDTARQQAVYQDAIAVRNAAAFYCAQPDTPADDCMYFANVAAKDARAGDQAIQYNEIDDLLDGFDPGPYQVNGNYTVAYRWGSSNNPQGYRVDLPADNSGDFEWVQWGIDPANGDADDVDPRP